jgi:leukotriene-A4 hydrolase
MRPLLDGVDPDDSFSSIPYEKGFGFLRHLEGLVGGPAAFEPFLHSYFSAFADKNVTTEMFMAHLRAHFAADSSNGGAAAVAALDALDLDAWLYGVGMPPSMPTFDNTASKEAKALAAEWKRADDAFCDDTGTGTLIGVPDSIEAGKVDVLSWPTTKFLIFLEEAVELGASASVGLGQQGNSPDGCWKPALLDTMSKLYGLADTKNAEIRFLWSMLCIKSGHEAAYGGATQFLGEQGRMKFVRPLYKALLKDGGAAGARLARATFASFKDQYHPIASNMIAKDLSVSL